MNSQELQPFDLEHFLATAGLSRSIRHYGQGETVFAQGDQADTVLYIQRGGVRLSVVARTGKEALIAVLAPGDFFGEGCLAGQPIRMSAAVAHPNASILAIEKREMVRVVHAEPALADRFLAHVLARNVRVESDLVDQLFNSTEKRLARTLLLLACYGRDDVPIREIVGVSQQMLAEMIGTTRERVTMFMNKFRRLGLISYNGAIIVHKSLLSVVLND